MSRRRRRRQQASARDPTCRPCRCRCHVANHPRPPSRCHCDAPTQPIDASTSQNGSVALQRRRRPDPAPPRGRRRSPQQQADSSPSWHLVRSCSRDRGTRPHRLTIASPSMLTSGWPKSRHHRLRDLDVRARHERCRDGDAQPARHVRTDQHQRGEELAADVTANLRRRLPPRTGPLTVTGRCP